MVAASGGFRDHQGSRSHSRLYVGDEIGDGAGVKRCSQILDEMECLMRNSRPRDEVPGASRRCPIICASSYREVR